MFWAHNRTNVKCKAMLMGRFAILNLAKVQCFVQICFKLKKISKFEFHDFYKEMYGRQVL